MNKNLIIKKKNLIYLQFSLQNLKKNDEYLRIIADIEI